MMSFQHFSLGGVWVPEEVIKMAIDLVDLIGTNTEAIEIDLPRILSEKPLLGYPAASACVSPCAACYRTSAGWMVDSVKGPALFASESKGKTRSDRPIKVSPFCFLFQVTVLCWQGRGSLHVGFREPSSLISQSLVKCS
jgi:hypothetical protein